MSASSVVRGGVVFSRKPGEEIVVSTGDGPISITVLAIRAKGTVRIQVAAPKCCSVDRREVFDAKLRTPKRTPPPPVVAATA